MHPDSPISGPLVSWGNAWLAGHTGLDAAVDRVERAGGPQIVAEPGAERPLRAVLAELRVEGMTALRLALPAAGDPLGLTGPAAFTMAAVDAGQAVTAVLPGRCVGLVPAPDRRGSSYAGIRWTAMDADPAPPDVPALAEAEHALTGAMRAAAEALAGVDGPPAGRPRLGGDEGLAPGYPARAHRVAALAARLAAVLAAAGERGVTSRQLATSGAALRELDRAVRRARVAAHNAVLEPRHAAGER
ncbi:hypothetical protein [Sphaerisporangium rufum]|uniref:hypothetical protein n=1 Tax=Sphaerisporangium rufum TaxID=1381558 RepID=UPI0019524944|nr:hypothetical protein [Sphaerisporangium rufum]